MRDGMMAAGDTGKWVTVVVSLLIAHRHGAFSDLIAIRGRYALQDNVI